MITLSAPHTAKGKLQRALLAQLDVHEREGTLPTSGRFLFYELVQAGVVSKTATGARRADQNLIDALTHLREAGAIPWDAIVDETRTMTTFDTAPSVAEYVLGSIDSASLDRWGGEPAPLILTESRSLSGVLRSLAATYACPITSTNGQSRGHLINEVAPTLESGQRVLYFGDWDHCGHQIEAATENTLVEHADDWPWDIFTEEEEQHDLWERVALTTAQVDAFDLRRLVISKLDKRYRNGGQYFDAVETEALSQGLLVSLLRARLDELMPEPLADVLAREAAQRTEVAEALQRLSD